MLKHIYFFILLIIVVCHNSYAGKISGIIVDAESKEQLVGAYIHLFNIDNNAEFNAISGLDGSFQINNLTAGSYELEVRYVGYLEVSDNFIINDDSQSIVKDYLREHDEQLLSEVVVTSNASGTDTQARQIERNSSSVLNVISAKQIQLSPDITVANVIQRVSGLSIEINASGDHQYAIIRGTVNMVMKSAPSSVLIDADLHIGYNHLNIDRPFGTYDRSNLSRKSPKETFGSNYRATPEDFPVENMILKEVTPLPDIFANATYGNRFFDKKLGLMIGGSYQNSYRPVENYIYDPNPNFSDENLLLMRELTYNAENDQIVDEAVYFQGTRNSRAWERNQDNDLSVYLDFMYKPGYINEKTEIKFGGLAGQKIRDNYFNYYNYSQVIGQFRGVDWNDFGEVAFRAMANPLGSGDRRDL